jgi:hypothetical protein
MGVKYSTTYAAQMARIRRLPQKYDEVIRGALLRDARGIVQEFRDGILHKTFRLTPLKPATIDRKASKGAEHPTFPLYDVGPGDERSYVNMMVVSKVKNGYVVRPNPRALHHSRKIKLKDLFVVHEYGATIKQWRGGKLILIRIPPRPAFELAYARYMRKRSKMEPAPAKEVKRAITEYITTGQERLAAKIREQKVEGMMRGLSEI